MHLRVHTSIVSVFLANSSHTAAPSDLANCAVAQQIPLAIAATTIVTIVTVAAVANFSTCPPKLMTLTPYRR